jgi:hypothetical protein
MCGAESVLCLTEEVSRRGLLLSIPIVSLLLSIPNLRATLYPLPRRRPLILANHHESLSVLCCWHAPSSNSRDFSPPRRRSCRPSSRLECRPHLRLLEVLSCLLLILWRRPEGTGGAHVVTFDHRTRPSLHTCTDYPPADALTFRRHDTRPRVKNNSPLDLPACRSKLL